MTLTLNLPPEMEERLKRLAEKNGKESVDFALALLDEAIEDKFEEEIAEPRNGAELVAILKKEGVIGSWANRTDIGDSVKFARELRRRAETRGSD